MSETTPEPISDPLQDPLPAEPTAIDEASPETSISKTEAPDEAHSGLELRERVLSLVAQDRSQIEAASERNALDSAPVPRLPDATGWLNDHIGTVRPQVHSWGGNDGSHHSRVTLANGQVICGRAAAPTSAEIFNPSMAMNIMHFRTCGRDRPTPTDRSDPWLRMPEQR